MTRPTVKTSTLRSHKERMLRVLVHIQQHLDDPLQLEHLAAIACLAPHHFHHVFTGMLGESLAGHIRRLRLERAAWRLKLSRMSVVQIALEAGYNTHEAFTRAFHNSYNMSPTQFRRHHGMTCQLQVPSGLHYRDGARLTGFHATRIGGKTMDVEIKQLSATRVAFMRHVGPYNEVGRTWDRFMMLLGKEGLLGGDVQFIGVCHDDPAVTPPDKIRYDACVTVDDRFRPQGEIGVQFIAGGDYAVMTHFGPYDRIGRSYAQLLGQWLPRSGRNLRLIPCFEVYLNSPENTEPADLVTDLYAPLEPS